MEGPAALIAAVRLLSVALVSSYGTASYAATSPGPRDVHQTEFGYFDIFVCNWPDRPPFLVGLFATTRAEEIAKIEVVRPDGKRVGAIALTQPENTKDMHGRERQAYKSQFAGARDMPNGWYEAVITLKNGARVRARDYVQIETMPVVTYLVPSNAAIPLSRARRLRWKPVAGDVFYRVTIQDMWRDKTLVYSSDLLRATEFTVPEGVLEPDGQYVWRVHARHATHDPKWGDFNHGSKSAEAMLSVTGD